MASPIGPYAAARTAALRASPELLAAMQLAAEPNIYVEVPVNAEVPYLVLGPVHLVSFTDEDPCAAEAELVDTINLWSKTSPLDEGTQAIAMGDVVLDVLGLSLAIPGWDVDERVIEQAIYVPDPDQSTHGTIEIRWLLTRQVS